MKPPSMSRRAALGLMAAAGVRAAFGQQTQPSGDPRFTDQPGEETPKIAALIDEAETMLRDKKADASAILCDPKFMAAHEWTRFRELIRANAPVGTISIVTKDEPGEAMRVRCRIVDPRGNAVAGAEVYLYHTSAKGWYSDRAPHYSGTAGDVKHARLFGWVKTDETGWFELKTIRPAGYPRSDLPQHIHVEIIPPGDALQGIVTEILFEDDDRLKPAGARERALRDHFVICPVNHGADRLQRVEAKISLRTKDEKRAR